MEMIEPQISDELFQRWLLNHIHILMKRPGKMKDVRLIYGSAFNDGWCAALRCLETNGNSVENTVQVSARQLF
jgi:hypothetical protein